MSTVNPKVAAWMARIAEALTEIGDCNPGWGEFYVSNVVIGFDGEDCELAIRPDDSGDGFELVLGA